MASRLGTTGRARPPATGAAVRIGRALALALALAGAAAGCTTVVARQPVPEASLADAAPYGIRVAEVLREFGDAIPPDQRDAIVAQRAEILRRTHADDLAAGRPIRQVSLALSGGGPDGAFGAGLLKGWTERGDRPVFDAVTGISTGAIIALFAYLGPEHDATLEEIYTSYTTEQLLTPSLFSALVGGSAVTDTSGYRGLIERYIDEEVMEALARAHEGGRLLLIGTTNLDASRPVIWNVGAIAATRRPEARRLVHDVVQASSAIPAAFPPVLIPVELPDGSRHDEMHVDGGATQQVMLFTPDLPMRLIDAALGVEIDRTLYVVVNNKLDKPYAPVRPRLISIAGHAASSLLGGSGSGDIYRMFAVAQRDGTALNVVSIPRDFDREAASPFDPVYMRALFELGREIGLAGDAWSPYPPDYAPWPPS